MFRPMCQDLIAILYVLGKDKIKLLMLEEKISVNDQDLIEKQTLITKYDSELRKTRSQLSEKVSVPLIAGF